MNEARKFIRYVIPGLVFAMMTAALFLILRPDRFSDVLGNLQSNSGLVLLAGGFLATGAMGFLFSAAYHAWHWQKNGKNMDHRESIKRLVHAGCLELRDPEQENSRIPETITREQAWIITTVLWHRNLKVLSGIETAEPKAAMLVDLSHSMGTVTVAAVAATVTAFTLAAFQSSPCCEFVPIALFVIATIVAAAIIRMLYSNYVRTAHFARDYIDAVLADSLEDSCRYGRLVRTNVFTHRSQNSGYQDNHEAST